MNPLRSKNWLLAVTGLLLALFVLTQVDGAPQPKAARKAAPGKSTQGKSKQEKATSKSTKAAGSETGVALSPAVFLLRDPLVQDELQLSPRQTIAAAEVAAEFNDSIWKLRDVTSETTSAFDEIRRINAAVSAKLNDFLNAAQIARLDEIVFRVKGLPAISEPEAARLLALSDEQRNRINTLNSEFQAALNDLRTRANSTKPPPDLGRTVEKLHTGRQTDILAVLNREQRDGWSRLTGKPIDLSKLRPLTAAAPELRGIEAWINSEPVSLKQLRGKVVALHFWTFG